MFLNNFQKQKIVKRKISHVFYSHLMVSGYCRLWTSVIPGAETRRCLLLSTLHKSRLKKDTSNVNMFYTDILVSFYAKKIHSLYEIARGHQ